MNADENIARSVSDYLLGEGMLSRTFVETDPMATTPIESTFYKALCIASNIGVSWFRLVNLEPADNTQMQVKSQCMVLDWLADYVFTVKSEYGPISRLVVECDGHAFHERTKEQAARDRGRDRRLQAAGLAIYRFTGSEIYRDAFGCARQVLKWAEGAAWLDLGK